MSIRTTVLAKTAGLAIALLTAGQGGGSSARAAEVTKPPSVVTAAGVTLNSVSVDLPDPGKLFPGGDKADAINNNCLACHSAGMILNQPPLTRTIWQGEIDKMRTTYKAPVWDADIPAILDYLTNLKGGT